METAATTTAVVKSKYLSKTNITALLLGIFGLAQAFGVLEPTADTAGLAGTVVTVGAALVVLFRTKTNAILR